MENNGVTLMVLYCRNIVSSTIVPNDYVSQVRIAIVVVYSPSAAIRAFITNYGDVYQ